MARGRRRQRRAARDHRLRHTPIPSTSTEVYKSFQPFDSRDGNGIVAAPPEEACSSRAVRPRRSSPELGKVWAAQERLWIQRTLLEVSTRSTRNAKDWDTAIIKQINLLEVGNPVAQDQRSIAKGETLAEAPKIDGPGRAGGGGGGRRRRRRGMAGMMGMMRGKGCGEMGG